MKVVVTPHLVELTYEALLKSFWRKESLRKFLRASYVNEAHLATWAVDESKREFLDRTFEKLQASDRGKALLARMASSLAEQKSFPDLRNWEDSELKTADARNAVQELRNYLAVQQEEERTEAEKREFRERAAAERAQVQRQQMDITKLRDRLDSLHSELGTQRAGYDFQDWFFDALDYSEIQNRRPYVSAGRQIDGSLTLEGTTYLVELKFTRSQASGPDIDSLRVKVDDKADNTMGVMVSIGGYSRPAVAGGSGRQTKLLLIDASHLYLFLSGGMSLSDIVKRLRRHASQTGEAFLPVAEFHT